MHSNLQSGGACAHQGSECLASFNFGGFVQSSFLGLRSNFEWRLLLNVLMLESCYPGALLCFSTLLAKGLLL